MPNPEFKTDFSKTPALDQVARRLETLKDKKRIIGIKNFLARRLERYKKKDDEKKYKVRKYRYEKFSRSLNLAPKKLELAEKRFNKGIF